MKNFQILLSITWSLIIICVSTSVYANPAYPFPQHEQYASGTILPNHRTRAQMDSDVITFYEQWKSDYLVTASGTSPFGGPLYRVIHSSSEPDRTVSEGQGYGMIITAHLAGYDPDAQEIFDGLWFFSREHPSDIDNRLMGWQVPEGSGNNSAFDGDADIAYGLLLAHKQWGSDGDVDYLGEAQTVITAIFESTIGPDSMLPMLGDWVNPYASHYNQYTPRTSDFMPSHFRAYGLFTSHPWDAVIATVQSEISELQTVYSPGVGLLPDFVEPVSSSDHSPRPADAYFLEGPHDGHYYYNAGRDPWRIALDALLYGDSTSLAQAQLIGGWIASATSENPANINAGYLLDGSPISGGNYFTTFFASPFGVAMMTRPDKQQFLNDIYDSVCMTHEDYYEDSVTMLCLLAMSGNFMAPGMDAQAPSLSFGGIVLLNLMMLGLILINRR